MARKKPHSKSVQNRLTKKHVAPGHLAPEHLEGRGRSVLQASFEVSSGPLPSPQNFEGYVRIYPKAAERLFDMAQEEQNIRKQGQDQHLDNEKLRIYGAIIVACIFIVFVCVYAILHNQAIVLALITVPPIIAAFLRHHKQKNNDNNSEEINNS